MKYLWQKIENWGSFPEEINERAARIVALLVLLLALAAILFDLRLAYLLPIGFFLRAWRGSQIDPFARFAVWFAPQISIPLLIPGPPKRFAQILGFLLTVLAAILLLLGIETGTIILLALLIILAALEALLGVCLGCRLFALFVRRRWLPEDVCWRCENLFS